MSRDQTFQLPEIESEQMALSGYDQLLVAGTAVGECRMAFDYEIVGFVVSCNPGNEPSSVAAQFNLNIVDLSSGTPTSLLSSIASIATGANESTGGAINGTPTGSAGDRLTIDCDQGVDGKGYTGTVYYRRT